MLMTFVWLFAGIGLLLMGGELVVRGASGLAFRMRLSPLFIGLTIVSLGTSSPELAVSIATAWSGQTDITIGNIVGSNLFNMLMIVGISAICLPLPVDRQVTRFDVPVMIATTILMLVLSLDGLVTWIDGIVLLTAMVFYFMISLKLGKSSASEEVRLELVDAPETKVNSAVGQIALLSLMLIGGIVLLVFGCDWFVDSCVTFARMLNISEAVIGLTIVSAGTSLPELVTSVAATIKGERGIAIGNAVGSTTLNVLAILGVTTMIAPAGIPVAPEMLHFDMPVMVGAAIVSWVLYRYGQLISRIDGMILSAFYGIYLYMLLK